MGYVVLVERLNMTKKSDSLGLEVAWLEDRPHEIARIRSYLEERNFVVHLSTDVDEMLGWVGSNSYDLLLVDLRFPGARGGLEFVSELKGSGLHIVPVTGYLGQYEKRLRRILPEAVDRAIDKGTLGGLEGLEEMRRGLLAQANGGKIEIIERCRGFTDEEPGDIIRVSVKLDDGSLRTVEVPKSRLFESTIGTPTGFLELTTLQRAKSGGVVMQTICKWLSPPKPQTS